MHQARARKLTVIARPLRPEARCRMSASQTDRLDAMCPSHLPGLLGYTSDRPLRPSVRDHWHATDV